MSSLLFTKTNESSWKLRFNRKELNINETWNFGWVEKSMSWACSTGSFKVSTFTLCTTLIYSLRPFAEKKRNM